MTLSHDKTHKILSALCNAMIDADTREWPPKCAFFSYQPFRPKHSNPNEREFSAEYHKIKTP